MKLKKVYEDITKTPITEYGMNDARMAGEAEESFRLNGFKGTITPQADENIMEFGHSQIIVKIENGSLILKMEDLKVKRNFSRAIEKLKEFLEFADY